MTQFAPAVDLRRLREAIESVEDPELPHVTIGDLGMVRDVSIEGETVHVTLATTYTGCPATDQIREDALETIRDAGFDADRAVVTFSLSPAWSTDWITDQGRERLAQAGIAPPPPAANPDGSVAVDLPVACPRCHSRRTRSLSFFGGTACKATYQCLSCSEPFEAFKAI